MTVGLAMEKVQQAKEFLQEHFDILIFARQNVQQAQDRYKKYANEHRRLVSFEEGERVFLKVSEHSQSLKTGIVAKLSPRYCGPFTILKSIGKVAYKLALPEVHPIFHVSRLRKQLGQNDNVVDTGVLVDIIEPPSVPHDPERILDMHEQRT